MIRALLAATLICGLTAEVGYFTSAVSPTSLADATHTFEAEIYNPATGETVRDTVQAEDVTSAEKIFKERYPGRQINFLHEVH